MTFPTLQQLWDDLTHQLNQAQLSFGHGAVDASSEALWILSSALKFPPEDTLEAMDMTLDQPVIDQAQQWAHERITTRKPLAYIVGDAWLMGIPFYCDERSIVPRSFIAELIVDGHLEPWLPPGATVLDLCTGNGSLAILLALACPDINLSAADISYPALALAAKNIDRHGLVKRIELFQGDLWDALPENNESCFDLIVCNPPYVNSLTMSRLPQEYLAEPQIALAGGKDGMDLIRKIIQEAGTYLKQDGALVLEIGNEAAHFVAAFPQIPITWLPVSAGDDQVLLIRKEDL
jgi:ribosomal protein L3 glutamine methyltransferase